MLVSALMGLGAMQAAYAHAIERGYRFYSYGDASLLLPGLRPALRYETFEVSDWGPNGDYYSETFVWQPLEPDEVAALRRDLGYKPTSEARFSYQPGWRSG